MNQTLENYEKPNFRPDFGQFVHIWAPTFFLWIFMASRIRNHGTHFFVHLITCLRTIRSNLRVAQSGRFVINLVYSRDDTTFAKILDFRLFENLKNALSKTFNCTKLSLESWIPLCLCEKFPEYLPDITMRTWKKVYLMAQHFSWFKNYRLFILRLVPGASFLSAKTMSDFVNMNLMVRMAIKSNART